MNQWFERMAIRITALAGSLSALLVATLLIVVWLVTGPLFHFSDTWQLVINTTTTIITFLMVFLIQSSTNREAKATQLKLDELIRAVQGARNVIIAAEKQPVETIADLEEEFEELAERGGIDTGEHTLSGAKRRRSAARSRAQAASTAGNGSHGRSGTRATDGGSKSGGSPSKGSTSKGSTSNGSTSNGSTSNAPEKPGSAPKR